MQSTVLIGSKARRLRDSKRIIAALIICGWGVSIQAQSLIPELCFKNPVLKTGGKSPAEGQDGAQYIFENVGWGMDALVTILGRSNPAVSLSTMDIPGPEQNLQTGTGLDDAWQPGIKFGEGKAPANTSWWMEFRISFVFHDDRETLMPVNQFFVSGLDIDGDGQQLHEFQAYYQTASYTLDRQTAIFASSVRGSESNPLLWGKRFDGPVKDYPGISLDAEDAMVSNFYSGTASMVVRLGAQTGKQASEKADRMYGLLFKSLAFGVPTLINESVDGVASRQSKN